MRPAPPPALADAEDDDPPDGPEPAPVPPEPRGDPAPPSAPPSPVASVQGSVRDATTGRSVDALVGIGRPGVDLRAELQALQTGRITAEEFDEDLYTQGRADLEGFFQISDIPRGATHSLVVARMGYRAIITDVRVGAGDALVDVGRIDLVSLR